jgi:hypothetical protein
MRLKDEYGFSGGYTVVKDYVRSAMLRSREMFVPLVHPAGEAQVDFGEALVVMAGVERKAHYLVMDLPQSDDCFVAAFPAETTEAFLEGHARAFAYFGGVPTRTARVNSLALVRYRANDYSVPTRYGHLQVLVRGYVHEVTISYASEVIARHPRSYERESVVFDPLHYLALLEEKTRALDQAAPLADWQLPTMLREYDRVARQCASEDVDYPRYLLRMTELELLGAMRRSCSASRSRSPAMSC